VKYAQAFWILSQISEVLTEQGLNLDETPLIMAGDFNSAPNSSSIHLLLNKEYLLSPETGRTDPKSGTTAYKKEEGVDMFNLVDKEFKRQRGSLSNVIGKLSSSH